jgi:hypothetical protein
VARSNHVTGLTDWINTPHGLQTHDGQRSGLSGLQGAGNLSSSGRFFANFPNGKVSDNNTSSSSPATLSMSYPVHRRI